MLFLEEEPDVGPVRGLLVTLLDPLSGCWRPSQEVLFRASSSGAAVLAVGDSTR